MAAGELAVPQEVVVVLAILVSGFIVAAGYAIHRTVAPHMFRANEWTHPGEEQHGYMVEVRKRNWV
jgi:hypothetical protein